MIRASGFFINIKVQPFFERQYFAFNQPNNLDKFPIIFACRIIQSPILPVFAGQIRTLNIAAHCDYNIYGRNVGQELAALCDLHVNAIKLFHQPNGILIDLWLNLRSRRIALECISGKMFTQRLRNLAAAGIVNTDECDFYHLDLP